MTETVIVGHNIRSENPLNNNDPNKKPHEPKQKLHKLNE